MSEYQVKRRMPWSISPRLAKGDSTYSRLASQVLAGEGRLVAQVLLETAQRMSTIAKPRSGSRSQSSLNIFIEAILASRQGRGGRHGPQKFPWRAWRPWR